MAWIKTSDQLPEEGQRVIVLVHTWSMCTGDGKSWLKDNGVFELNSWFTNKPYPTEHGHFLNGFAFDDYAYPCTLHRTPEVRYWAPLVTDQYPPDA